MSGLAKYLRELGYQVTGSDLQRTEITDRLSALGIQIYFGHQSKNLPAQCGLVVKSAAIDKDNPELIEAHNRQVPVTKYAQLLGQLMKDKYGIAVSGSHGKTTACALLTYVLDKAGYKPSFVVGGYIPDLKASARMGEGEHFVAEACEYDRSFLNLMPQVGVILNLESDHLDYFKHLESLIEAFRRFVSQIAKDGYLIANVSDKNVAQCLKSARCPVIKFTTSSNELPKAEWRIGKVVLSSTIPGGLSFEVVRHDQLYGKFTLKMPGRHNLNNALIAIIISYLLKIDKSVVQQALSEFSGITRRFELVGRLNNVTIIDDYAHHPTELDATIKTMQETYPEKRIWYVFQPHQYNRTRLFLKQFVSVLAPLKNLIITDIFLARDSVEEQKKISAFDLVQKINESGGQSKYLAKFDEITEYLQQKIVPGDAIITMGAGNIYKVAQRLANSVS